MTDDNDFVQVLGDFEFISSVPHQGYLTAGTLEIKGDFFEDSLIVSDFGVFLPSGSHKVILSGEDTQEVTSYDYKTSIFNSLELRNTSTDGVTFANPLQLYHFNPNDTTVSELIILDSSLTLQNDWIITNYLNLDNSSF